jgi:23S rRNA (cytosine1962-C5)-methyltransferase
VIRDAQTGDLGLFARGDLAELVDPKDQPVATALVEPEAAICARVVAPSSDPPLGKRPWIRRVLAAARKREHNVGSADTNAYRVIHGEADGLPGLFVDRWDDVLVVTRTTPLADLFRPTYAELLSATHCDALWEQDHFEDLRACGASPGSASRAGRWVIGERAAPRWTVLESGLRYLVEPSAGLTHGLYTDQRANRDLLRRMIEDAPETGRSIANLFSHTAAFSVACAAGGAAQVFSIDLAQRYAEWAGQNLVLNGIDPAQHPLVAAGAMEWLTRAEGLSGVILDPPAHARSKTSRGMDWNARRDYRALVAAAAKALCPGGWLLCCVNLKGLKRDWLLREVEAGLREAKRRPEQRPVLAPPSPDHPRRKGFPEGRAFHGLFVRTAQ